MHKSEKSQKNTVKICIFHFPFAYAKNGAKKIEGRKNEKAKKFEEK